MTEATTPANAASAARQHGRRLLFALAVLAVVIAPVILLNQLSRSAQNAADLVAHTYRVEAAASRLAWTVRDVESAALLQAISGDVPLAETRLAEGRRALPGQIEALARLTADNPRQQMRVGRLAELVESRLEVVQQVQDASPAQRAQTALALVDRFPIRALLQEIMAEETRLLSVRNADAERRRLQATWLGWSAMLAQLVLLGAITWLLWRQIGDRMRAQAQGRTAEVRAQAMLQTVRDPIALIDRQQRVVMHNSAFAELYGEVQPMQRLIDVGDGAWRDPVVHQRLSDVLARGRELWDLESAQTTADGVSRTLMLNARRMQLPDSEESVALLTLADVSAQKATQQRLDEVNRQLSGKVEQVSDVNRELEAFSYSVSHDLRAPLRHVSGFADKLARHLGDSADDKSKHYVEVISTSARRMSQLIDDLLVYSRLGRSAMRLQAADMQSLVSETRALLDANAEAEGRTTPVQWRIAPLPIVVCDENMMRQVWLNLLGNAVKYSARSPQPVVEVGYERLDDGGHQFVVRDNGAGFDMAYAGKLFGVFQRLHKASEYPGTGIGLASVRRVLGRHGGRIWAESAPGQGAAFHFVLPAALDAPVSDTQPNENPT